MPSLNPSQVLKLVMSWWHMSWWYPSPANSMTTIVDLPTEVLSTLGRSLPTLDLLQFRYSCKVISSAVRGDRKLFRRILLHKFHRKLTRRDRLSVCKDTNALARPGFACVRHDFLEAVEVKVPRDARLVMRIHVGPSMALLRDLILRKDQALRTNVSDMVQIRRCVSCVVSISFNTLDSDLVLSDIDVTTVSLLAPGTLLSPGKDFWRIQRGRPFILPRPFYWSGCLVHYALVNGDAQFMFCKGQKESPFHCYCVQDGVGA
jgi:hypothetical protein